MLAASIDPFGAELSSLRDAEGRELMTDADPAYWTGRAPLLFPIVGALNRDTYRVDGHEYSLPKHGFARRMLFETIEAAADRATFRLTDSEATLAVYPWRFALDVTFALAAAALLVEVTIGNPGDAPLPAGFGFGTGNEHFVEG